MRNDQRIRVLHVVESYGGGVASAIDEYVRSTPDVDHHLLRAPRPGLRVGAGVRFSSVHDLPRGTRALAAIRRTVRRLQPHVLHAHSSFAGGYARLALSTAQVPVVYTPHCFAFQRTDVAQPVAAAFALVERILALNTSVLAGCSAYEAAVGARWLGHDRAVFVPNISTAAQAAPRRVEASAVKVVAGMGRLAAQKDPAWFADVVRQVDRRRDVAAVWIGDGEEDRGALTAAGVRVSGWQSRAEAVRTLAASHCYVHSAAWEGAPMAVLEAVEVGVPVVVRAVPSMAGAPSRALAHRPADAAELVTRILADDRAADDNLAAWRRALTINSRPVQRERLLTAYQRALEVAGAAGARPRRARSAGVRVPRPEVAHG